MRPRKWEHIAFAFFMLALWSAIAFAEDEPTIIIEADKEAETYCKIPTIVSHICETKKEGSIKYLYCMDKSYKVTRYILEGDQA